MIYWIPLIDLDNMMLWSSSYILVSSLECHLLTSAIIYDLEPYDDRVIAAH